MREADIVPMIQYPRKCLKQDCEDEWVTCRYAIRPSSLPSFESVVSGDREGSGKEGLGIGRFDY